MSLNLRGLTRDAYLCPVSELLVQPVPRELGCHQCLCHSDGRVSKAVENPAAPNSRDDGSRLSSRYVKCCVCEPKSYILQYQAQDGSAVGEHGHQGRVVDARYQSVDSIDDSVRKPICVFITLPRYVLYAGNVSLTKANVNGLWSVKAVKSLSSRR